MSWLFLFLLDSERRADQAPQQADLTRCADGRLRLEHRLLSVRLDVEAVLDLADEVDLELALQRLRRMLIDHRGSAEAG